MVTRSCASCGEDKTVAGVWYLLAHGSARFMCSTCFGEGRFEAL